MANNFTFAVEPKVNDQIRKIVLVKDMAPKLTKLLFNKVRFEI